MVPFTLSIVMLPWWLLGLRRMLSVFSAFIGSTQRGWKQVGWEWEGLLPAAVTSAAGIGSVLAAPSRNQPGPRQRSSLKSSPSDILLQTSPLRHPPSEVTIQLSTLSVSPQRSQQLPVSPQRKRALHPNSSDMLSGSGPQLFLLVPPSPSPTEEIGIRIHVLFLFLYMEF